MSGALVGNLKSSYCPEKNYEEPNSLQTLHSTVVIGSAFISSSEVYFLWLSVSLTALLFCFLSLSCSCSEEVIEIYEHYYAHKHLPLSSPSSLPYLTFNFFLFKILLIKGNSGKLTCWKEKCQLIVSPFFSRIYLELTLAPYVFLENKNDWICVCVIGLFGKCTHLPGEEKDSLGRGS